MKKPSNMLPAALGTLALVLALLAAPVRAQDRDDYPGGSLDAHHHGYEHGYRDGYEYGLSARDRGVGLDFHTDAYQDAMRGYNPAFGPADAFRNGYREGYQAGAQDAFGGARSRLQQTFGRRDYDPDRYRGDDARIYREHRWSSQDVASDIGYRDGVNAGMRDVSENRPFSPHTHEAWTNADHGYSESYGDRSDYIHNYRAAYESGYRDGFGGVRR